MKKPLLLACYVVLFSSLWAAEPEAPGEKTTRYHQLLLKRPESATLFERFVDSWLDEGSKEGLEAYLKTEAKSGSAAEWRLLAAYQDWMGREELALAAISKALEKNPKSSDLFFARAKLKARLLDFEGALSDLGKLPKGFNEEAATLKGSWLARSGQPEKALAAWKEILAERPNDEELREDLIELQIEEGLYKEAIQTGTNLAKGSRDPYKRAVRFLRVANIQVIAGEKEDGLKTYRKILEMSGEGSWLEKEVLAQVEKVFRRDGNIVGLREFYSALREKFPQRVSLRKGLAFQMAANGETDEAISLFREILKITPNNLENRQQFLTLLENAERHDLAITEQEFILRSRGDQPSEWERMARLKNLKGDAKGLHEALEKVRALRATKPQGVIATSALYKRYQMHDEAEALLRKGRQDFPQASEITEALATFLADSKGNKEKQTEATNLWLRMAEGSDAEGLLRISRSLLSHQRAEACFKLLSQRISEFPKNLLLLKQLCNAAHASDKAEEALPFALKLAELAETPADFGAALGEIARLSRQLDHQNLITKQKNKAEKTAKDWCVLAELYEIQGDVLSSDQALAEAKKIANGPLVLSQQIRLLESRDELAKAAESMRELIALPGGSRPAYLRKLVDLLSKDGKVDEALAATERWKQVAPSDRSAWLRRAELLGASGELEKAVAELRRAQAKFEDDVELKSRLADAMVEAGEYSEGERIYRKLYQDAESNHSKVRWIERLAALAKQESRVDELLEEFERRKRRNPQDAGPLQALATIHAALGDYNMQREALAEAVRRKPKVIALRHQLAQVEERAGDINRAMATMREAARLDRTPDSRQKLVSLYFRHSEIEKGLDLLREMNSGNPREIEATAYSLMRNGEWETALEYLAEYSGTDWRLTFLTGISEYNLGNKKNARVLFRELTAVTDEIDGLKPLISEDLMQRWRAWIQPHSIVEPTREMILTNIMISGARHFLNMKQQGYRSNRSSGNQKQTLPGTTEEMRSLALALLIQDANSQSEDEKKQLIGKVPYPSGVFGQQLKNQHRLAAWVTEEMKAGRLDLATAVTFAAEDKELDIEVLKRAADELFENNPKAANVALRALISRKEGGSNKHMMRRLELLKRIPREERNHRLAQLANDIFGSRQNSYSYEETSIGFVPNSTTKEAFKKILIAEIESKLENRKGKTSLVKQPWFQSFLMDTWKAGDAKTFVQLANHLLADHAESNHSKPGMYYYSGSHYPASAFGGRQNRDSITRPPSFPRLHSNTPIVLQQIFLYALQLKKQSPSGQAGKQSGFEEKWKASRKIVSNKNKGKQTERSDGMKPEDLAPFVAELKSPSIRILAQFWMNKSGELEKELANFESSQNADEVLTAAGYWFQKGEVEKSYQLLVQARLLPMDKQQRQAVDSELVFVGTQLAKSGTSPDKLEDARRATLRLRRSAHSDKEKEQLISAMTVLGLGDIATQIQMARLRKGALSNSQKSTPFGLNRNAQNIGLNQKNKDAAARAGLRNLRTLLRNPYNSWQTEELVKKIRANQLADLILKLANPGDTRSFSRRMEFARVAIALGKGKEALPILKSLAKDRPNDSEVAALIMRHLPLQEKIVKARAMMKSATKQEFGQLILLIAEREYHDPFQAKNEIENITQAQKLLDALSITTDYLSQLEPSDETSHDLSWVTALASVETLDDWTLDKVRSPGYLESSKRESDFEKKRLNLTRKFFETSLRHPQLAAQMFSLIEAHKKGLQYSEDEILKFALAAFKASSVLEDSVAKGQTWTAHSGGSYHSHELEVIGKYPDDYLSERIILGDAQTSQKLLQQLQEFAPGKVKELKEIQRFSSGSQEQAKEILEVWKGRLADDPYERVSHYHDLLFLSIHSGAPDKRLKDLEQAFFNELVQQIPALGNQQNYDFTKPAFAYFQKSGSKALQAYQDRMLIALIGPKEMWSEWLSFATEQRATDQSLMWTNYFVRKYGEEMVKSCQSLDQVLAVARCRPLLWGGEDYISGVLENFYEASSMAETHAVLKKTNFWARPWAELGQPMNLDGDETMMEVFLRAVLNGYNIYDFATRMSNAQGGRRFRNRLAAAILREPNRGQMVGELEGVAGGLVKLPPEELAGVKNLVKQLYPSLRVPNAKPKTKLLLQKLNDGQQNDLLAQARQQIKEGFGGRMHEYSGREKIMEQTLALIPEDAKLAADFFAAAINDPPRNQRGPFTRVIYSSGYTHPTRQDELFDDLLRDAEKIPLIDWAKFQNHFERLPDAPPLSVGHVDRYALRDLVMNFWNSQPKYKNLKGLEGKIFNGTSHWKDLPQPFAKEDRLTQETCALYLWFYAAGRWDVRNPPAHWQWLKSTKYMEKHPIFGQRNLTVLAQQAWSDLPPEAHQLAQKKWLDVLSNKNLTTRLRMELACKSLTGEPRLSDTPETIAQVSELLAKYIAEGRALDAKPIVGLLSGLSQVETPLNKEVWVPLLKECNKAYLKIVAKRGSSEEIKKEFAMALIHLGLKVEDPETVRPAFNLAKVFLKGDIDLMLELVSVGQADLAKQLVTSPDQLYVVSDDIKWSPEFDKKITTLLPLIKNPQERFRIHCILANLPVEKDEYKKERTNKLVAVAKRFKAEAPHAQQARIQCLRSFIKSRDAQNLLFDELEKVSQTYSIVSAFDQKLMPGNLSASNVKEVIYHHLWTMARQGRLKMIDHQVENVARALAADEDDYSLNRECTRFFHDMMQGYLNGKHARKEATASADNLALAKKWYRLIARINPSNSLVRHRSVSLPYSIYVLAGKAQEFHQWVNTLPEEEQAAYKREFSKTPYYIVTCWSRSKVWSDKKDTAELRKFLVTAFFNDHFACRAIFSEYINVRHLLINKVLKIKELDSIIAGLAKDHPQAAALKMELGVTYGRFHVKQERARGMKLIREAITEAAASKDVATLNIARAELAFIIGEKIRNPKKALEIARQIDWKHVPPKVADPIKKKITQFQQRVKAQANPPSKKR